MHNTVLTYTALDLGHNTLWKLKAAGIHLAVHVHHQCIQVLLAKLITRTLLGGQVDVTDHDCHTQQFLQLGLPFQIVLPCVQEKSWSRSNQASGSTHITQRQH